MENNTPLIHNQNTSIHSSFEQAPPIFLRKLKIGVYKELHKKGLITTQQLHALTGLQKDEVISKEVD